MPRAFLKTVHYAKSHNKNHSFYGEKGTTLKKHFINNVFKEKDRNLVKKKKKTGTQLKKKYSFTLAKWLNSQVLQ